MPLFGGKFDRGFGVERVVKADLLVNSYEHNSIHEPAILLGGAFVVDIAKKGMQAS
jgi:hypothetical protein